MDFISVGVIPLGTGNDMARFLGWGVGYHGEALAPVIQSLAVSESRLLDRWLIDVQPTMQSGTAELKVTDPLSNEYSKDSLRSFQIPQPVFNNYLSFGADAQVH